MPTTATRRRFLQLAGAAVAAPAVLHAQTKPSRLVRLAFIGLGGRGSRLIHFLGGPDTVCTAFCDPNRNRWGGIAKRFPEAKGYQDYRKLYDEMHKEVDAVVVATPDHHHVPAAIRAVRLGKACYCEKPLGYSVYEVRALADATRAAKVPTQMGNQGHANQGNRLTVEWIRDGAIGPVKEVHTWTDRPARYWQHGLKQIPPATPVPPDFDWECWLGPRTWPHYSPDVLRAMWWRCWYGLGTGAIGDQICHGWDNVYWSMDPGAPTRVEPIDPVGKTDLSPPLQSTVKFTFAERNGRPGFVAYYHTGGRKPPAPEAFLNDPARQGRDGKKPELPTTGTLYLGTKGALLSSGDYGESVRLVPEESMKAWKRVGQPLAPSPGHQNEWFMAIRGEQPWDFPRSNFIYGAGLTEVGLLGIAAERLGRTIEYDAASMKVTNEPEANAYIKPTFRKGWEIEA